eukprot:423522_1
MSRTTNHILYTYILYIFCTLVSSHVQIQSLKVLKPSLYPSLKPYYTDNKVMSTSQSKCESQKKSVSFCLNNNQYINPSRNAAPSSILPHQSIASLDTAQTIANSDSESDSPISTNEESKSSEHHDNEDNNEENGSHTKTRDMTGKFVSHDSVENDQAILSALERGLTSKQIGKSAQFNATSSKVGSRFKNKNKITSLKGLNVQAYHPVNSQTVFFHINKIIAVDVGDYPTINPAQSMEWNDIYHKAQKEQFNLLVNLDCYEPETKRPENKSDAWSRRVICGRKRDSLSAGIAGDLFEETSAKRRKLNHEEAIDHAHEEARANNNNNNRKTIDHDMDNEYRMNAKEEMNEEANQANNNNNKKAIEMDNKVRMNDKEPMNEQPMNRNSRNNKDETPKNRELEPGEDCIVM